MSEEMQEHVLTMEMRYELWETFLPNYTLQEGAEPLQLQIPRGKRRLLVGEVQYDSNGRKCMPQLDRLRTLLPHEIEISFQDPQDDAFPYILLYIGVKRPFRHVFTKSLGISLALAWKPLYHWAVAVNQDTYMVADVWYGYKLGRLTDMLMGQCLEFDIVTKKASDFCKNLGIFKDLTSVPPEDDTYEQEAERKLEQYRQEMLSACAKALSEEQDKIKEALEPFLAQVHKSLEENQALDLEEFQETLNGVAQQGIDPVSRCRMIQAVCDEWAQ